MSGTREAIPSSSVGSVVSNASSDDKSQKKIMEIADDILFIEQNHSLSLLQLDYTHTRIQSNVTHVYNPLGYAAIPHSKFVKQYGNTKRKILFMGMNPGPYGMAQTGVPFGDVKCVKEWLGITGDVSKPKNEHPKRPIDGFSCSRSEVSGTRLWGLIKTLSHNNPNQFFDTCYIHNYCPLSFMSMTGKNVTPPMFRACVRREFHDICDRALLQMIELLQIEVVIAIGKYVEGRTNEALKQFSKWKVNVFLIMHPSPINPAANKGKWEDLAMKQLKEHNILDIIQRN